MDTLNTVILQCDFIGTSYRQTFYPLSTQNQRSDKTWPTKVQRHEKKKITVILAECTAYFKTEPGSSFVLRPLPQDSCQREGVMQ